MVTLGQKILVWILKYPDLNYAGDGSFNDNGRRSGINRFVLDLGSVDLSDDSYHTYHLKGLPEVKFICYLRLDHSLPLPGSPKDFKSEKTIIKVVENGIQRAKGQPGIATTCRWNVASL